MLAATVPWAVRYRSFTGALPSITSITLQIIAGQGAIAVLQFHAEGGQSCLATIDRVNVIELTGALSERGGMTSVEARYGPVRAQGAFLCEELRVRLSGTGSSTVLGESAVPTFRLTEEVLRAPVAPSLSGSGEFGRVEAGSVARRVITINAGTEAITVESIRVRLGNFFAITDPNRCIGSRIAVGGRCSFEVVFTAPSEAGRSVEDELTVEGGLSSLHLTLRGST